MEFHSRKLAKDSTGHSRTHIRYNMHHTTKIRAIGNSQGVTLPKALLERYHLREGDEVTAIETQEGILLKAQDAAFEKGMEFFDKFSHKYRNALKELAK